MDAMLRVEIEETLAHTPETFIPHEILWADRTQLDKYIQENWNKFPLFIRAALQQQKQAETGTNFRTVLYHARYNFLAGYISCHQQEIKDILGGVDNYETYT